jgi:hypothetical protein
VTGFLVDRLPPGRQCVESRPFTERVLCDAQLLGRLHRCQLDAQSWHFVLMVRFHRELTKTHSLREFAAIRYAFNVRGQGISARNMDYP